MQLEAIKLFSAATFLLLNVNVNPFIRAAGMADSNAQPKKFRNDFLFGVASAAYQIEGAWNVDGKGTNIWDEYIHLHPEKIFDGSNVNVGPNSYEYYEDDINAVKSLGVNFYRFSISWSRVLPGGDTAHINEAGIEYYNKVINKLLENHVEPMVTMYHFDLPNELQKLGGWANPIIVNYFEAYANLLFERFGDRVKYWITINEPQVFCLSGYGDDMHAPGINAHGVGEYLCGHNALKAHALAYHLYKRTYYNRFKGQIGIGLNTMFFYSKTNNTDDVDKALQFDFGWFARPIFVDGNYPSVMISQIANNSKDENRSWSRLPEFSEEWRNQIKGSVDFLGLNYYTSVYVESVKMAEGVSPSHHRDKMLRFSIDSKWKRGKARWHYSVPTGISDLLRWIKREYKNPMVIITENGWSDDGELNDTGRIEYFRDHIEQLLEAVLNDGCNLKGYTAWSIIDNFEWERGYSEKFGLFSVNMSSPRKERTPKKSAEFLRKLVETRQIPE